MQNATKIEIVDNYQIMLFIQQKILKEAAFWIYRFVHSDRSGFWTFP